MISIAKSVINRSSELKYVDYGLSGSQSYNGTILSVCTLINGGVGQDQRVGAKIRLVGMRVHVEFVGNQNSGVTESAIRFIVCRGYSENNTAMTVSTVLTQAGTAAAILSPFVFNSSKKYKILKDKLFTMSAGYSAITNATVPGFSTRKFYKKFFKFRHECTFISNAVNNIMDGGVYIIGISDEAASAVNPFMFYYLRLYYTDA